MDPQTHLWNSSLKLKGLYSSINSFLHCTPVILWFIASISPRLALINLSQWISYATDNKDKRNRHIEHVGSRKEGWSKVKTLTCSEIIIFTRKRVLIRWHFAYHRILLTSTSEVYGDPLEHPQTEEYWGNVNPIGISTDSFLVPHWT